LRKPSKIFKFLDGLPVEVWRGIRFDLFREYLELDYEWRLALMIVVVAPVIEELVKTVGEYLFRYNIIKSVSIPILVTLYEALAYGMNWWGQLVLYIVLLRLLLVGHLIFWYIRWQYRFNIYSIIVTIGLHAFWNYSAFNATLYYYWLFLPAITALVIFLLMAKYRIKPVPIIKAVIKPGREK